MELPLLLQTGEAEPRLPRSLRSVSNQGRRVKKQLTPLRLKTPLHSGSAENISTVLDTVTDCSFRQRGLSHSSSVGIIPVKADTSCVDLPKNKATLPPLPTKIGTLPSPGELVSPKKLARKVATGTGSQFEHVKSFNRAFGLNVASVPRHDIFDAEPEVAERCLNLILEETRELEQGFAKKSLTEVTDALADLIYVVYNAGAACGIDLDHAFDIVHKSNMTKLCTTEDEAKATVEWYIQNRPERYDSPAYRRADDGHHWVVFNRSTGKPLKSVNWIEPDFSRLGI